MKPLKEFISWTREVISESFNSNVTLSEAKGHIDHPEDLVLLNGSQGIAQAISAIESTVVNPKNITIKWDGYPALIFGRGVDGKFTILDKHMFNKKDDAVRKIHSPQEWANYEQQRGEKARPELLKIINYIWNDLERASPGKGYYWGDLLFRAPLQDQNGYYRFRANPNGISYAVEVDSNIGQLLTNKIAGIAVHQYLEPAAISTDEAKSLNGTTGQLNNNTSIAIVPSAMPIVPNIKVNDKLLNVAKTAQQNYGQTLDQFLNNAPQSRTQFVQLFTTYINSKIVSGNLQNLISDFYEYFKRRPMTDVMRTKLTNYFSENKQGIKALFAAWIAIYNLKNNIVRQLDAASKASPVKGYLQDGTETHEGFVSNGVKFVNRMGFARQNLAGRQKTAESLTEATSNKKLLVIYPGGFHPFHLGHASLYNHLEEVFPDADIYVAATDTTTERPFNFKDKKFLAGQAGVPENKFIKVTSPYRAIEITGLYDPKNTALVFAVSEKDRDRFDFKPKKDGSPSYFQPLEKKKIKTLDKHAYIYITPKIDFTILGQQVDSASKIRNMYAIADDEDRAEIANDLYPDSSNPKKVKSILDKYLANTISEADHPDYSSGTASAIPGTPRSLHVSSEESDEDYQKELNSLLKFMGR